MEEKKNCQAYLKKRFNRRSNGPGYGKGVGVSGYGRRAISIAGYGRLVPKCRERIRSPISECDIEVPLPLRTGVALIRWCGG